MLIEVEKRGMENGVGVIYCGTLEGLAFWTLKKSRVSVIAVLYHHGAEVHSISTNCTALV
jgi:hypothetical protein